MRCNDRARSKKWALARILRRLQRWKRSWDEWVALRTERVRCPDAGHEFPAALNYNRCKSMVELVFLGQRRSMDMVERSSRCCVRATLHCPPLKPHDRYPISAFGGRRPGSTPGWVVDYFLFETSGARSAARTHAAPRLRLRFEPSTSRP